MGKLSPNADKNICAVGSGKAEIHQRDIGPMASKLRHRVPGERDQQHIPLRSNDRAESFAKNRMILNGENANWLTVAGFDWGARTADVMAVLWPERCKAIVSVSGYLISSPAGNQTPWPPQAAFAFWYQYYFATEVGKAGYAKYLDEFNKFIWRQASPKWNFDDATYNRTAASFNNPDHVDIVMHDYRWRLGLADGERKYDDLEKRLAALPVVTVPAITMEGDSNGAIHAPSTAYRNKFSGKYDYRLITGGVGHNLPQEAPQAFAQAVVDVDSFS